MKLENGVVLRHVRFVLKLFKPFRAAVFILSKQDKGVPWAVMETCSPVAAPLTIRSLKCKIKKKVQLC